MQCRCLEDVVAVLKQLRNDMKEIVLDGFCVMPCVGRVLVRGVDALNIQKMTFPPAMYSKLMGCCEHRLGRGLSLPRAFCSCLVTLSRISGDLAVPHSSTT